MNCWWHQHSVSVIDGWKVETHTIRMNVSVHIISPPPHSSIHPSSCVVTVSRATQTPPLPFHLAKQKEAASLRSGSFQNSLSFATNSSAILNFLAFLTRLVYPARGKPIPTFLKFPLDFCKTIVTGIFSLCSARSILAICVLEHCVIC